jgi:hypothetical protein
MIDLYIPGQTIYQRSIQNQYEEWYRIRFDYRQQEIEKNIDTYMQ